MSLKICKHCGENLPLDASHCKCVEEVKSHKFIVEIPYIFYAEVFDSLSDVASFTGLEYDKILDSLGENINGFVIHETEGTP